MLSTFGLKPIEGLSCFLFPFRKMKILMTPFFIFFQTRDEMMGLFHIRKIGRVFFVYVKASMNAHYPKFPSPPTLMTCPTFVVIHFHAPSVF